MIFSPSSCNFISSHPKILPSTPFSNTLSLCFSLINQRTSPYFPRQQSQFLALHVQHRVLFSISTHHQEVYAHGKQGSIPESDRVIQHTPNWGPDERSEREERGPQSRYHPVCGHVVRKPTGPAGNTCTGKQQRYTQHWHSQRLTTGDRHSQ
jgi:hypothetical protein